MHHTLRFYSRYQPQFLRMYIALARLTRLPLVGGLVRRVANLYARHGHRSYRLTPAEAEQIIDAASSVAVGPCQCRQVFGHCQHPVMSEILIGTGAVVFSQTRPHDFNPVSKEAAKELVRRCHRERLVTNISKCQGHFYAICNCCPCCCVPTRLRREYGIEYALVRDKKFMAGFPGIKTPG
ncbi:MAG: ferredoxin-like protein [Chloroflexota bacterium]